MTALVRCKACGYIMREDRVRRVCPACGLRKSVFRPYKDRVSARRRLIVNLDLHPIAVHFPQAFAAILPLLIVGKMMFPGFYGQEIQAVVCFLILVLPLTAVAAIISGLIDGGTKLKTLTTPALIKKASAAFAFLTFTGINAAIVLLYGFHAGTQIFVLAGSLGALVCAVLLGMMGKKLIEAILPG